MIRLLIKLVTCEEHKEELRKLDKKIFSELMEKVRVNLKSEDEQVFCNSCNLGGYILELLSER